MELNTDALDGSGFFDPRYTCDFDNSSPELRWTGAPDDSQGFVLVAEDLDARQTPFVHWLVYNIPAHVHHLPAGIPAQETLPNGIRQGLNGMGKLGYGGPNPPIGEQAHRYLFRVHALSALPELPSRANHAQVMDAIQPFILASAELTGRYARAVQKAG